MQARSHKKEVILVHFRDKEIGLALNMVLNLRKLTFEHFILLTLDESSCQHVMMAFPKAGKIPFMAQYAARNEGGRLCRFGSQQRAVDFTFPCATA